MNFSRFATTTYHSFQSVYQVGPMKGFQSFFRVLGRRIRRETTPNDRANRRRQHMLKPLKINNEPHLGKQKPVKGKHEPHCGINEPLRRMNEPLCGEIEPVRGINEALRGKNYPVFIQGERYVHVHVPLIDRTSVKAVVIQKENCARTITAVGNYDFCLDSTESCDVTPSKTLKCACRSTARKFATQSNVKRCRDREPSRIPVKKIVQTMRRRKVRPKVKRILRTCAPKSSSMYKLATDYKSWYVNLVHRSNCFFSKFYRLPKYCTRVHKCNSRTQSSLFCKIHSCNYCYFDYEQYCVSKRKLFMSGDIELNPGPVQNDNNQDMAITLPSNRLEFRLHQLGLRPLDVGGAGDCFLELFLISYMVIQIFTWISGLLPSNI